MAFTKKTWSNGSELTPDDLNRYEEALAAHDGNKIDKTQIKNTLTETVVGNVLDSTQGKILDDKISILSNDNLLSEAINKMISGATCKISGYGDSVTAGYTATVPYTTVLQEKIRKICHNDNITVINQGTPNWESKEALSYIGNVLSESPDLVIIMFGINDCRGTLSGMVQVPLETYLANMKAVCNTFIKNGIAVLLMTPNPVTESITNYRLKSYCIALKDLSVKMGIKLVDINHIFEDLYIRKIKAPTRLLTDKLHPNNDGLSYIADNILAELFGINKISEDINIPFFGTDLCRTDITNRYNYQDMFYYATYVLQSGSGTYLTCPFFVNMSSISKIELNSLKYNGGASFNIRIDGEIVKEINAYNATTLYNVLFEIDTNISYGLHFFEIYLSDKTTTSAGDGIHLSNLKITTGLPTAEKIDIPFPYNIGFSAYGGGYASKVSKVNNFIQITITFKKTDNTNMSGMLNIGTLPIGYRPTENILFYGGAVNNGAEIKVTGEVLVNVPNLTTYGVVLGFYI